MFVPHRQRQTEIVTAWPLDAGKNRSNITIDTIFKPFELFRSNQADEVKIPIPIWGFYFYTSLFLAAKKQL